MAAIKRTESTVPAIPESLVLKLPPATVAKITIVHRQILALQERMNDLVIVALENQGHDPSAYDLARPIDLDSGEIELVRKAPA